MSDLANSCEYHTPEATCLAIAENPKAKNNRQTKCLNDEKQCCCYICDSRRECTISCNYLGNVENQEPQDTSNFQLVEPPTDPKTATQASKTKNYPIYCTSCNVEMSPKSAKLKLDELEPQAPKHLGDYTPQNEHSLPVIIYLCPLCGRIEFRSGK